MFRPAEERLKVEVGGLGRDVRRLLVLDDPLKFVTRSQVFDLLTKTV